MTHLSIQKIQNFQQTRRKKAKIKTEIIHLFVYIIHIPNSCNPKAVLVGGSAELGHCKGKSCGL